MGIREDLLHQVGEAVILGFKENGIDAHIEEDREQFGDRYFVSVAWKDPRVTWDDYARVSMEWCDDSPSETMVRTWYGCRCVTKDLCDPMFVSYIYELASDSIDAGYVPVMVGLRKAVEKAVDKLKEAKKAKIAAEKRKREELASEWQRKISED